MARRNPNLEELDAGANFLTDFYMKLREAVRRRGGQFADIHRLVKKGGEELFGKIADFIVGKATEASAEIFKVIVDYTKSLAEMIAAGKYDWANDDITEEHFPVPKPPAGLPVKAELNLELAHFNKCITFEKAIAELKKRGLRPATLPELLAFGTTYPEKQQEFSIVALGSVWRDWDGDRCVASLWSNFGGRRLSLDYRGDEHCRFLAVRES